jgi:AAA domain
VILLNDSINHNLSEEQDLTVVPPQLSKGSHPVLKGQYLIDTLEINRVKDKILDWAAQRLPGAIIYGDTRLGKTRSIEYLEKLFEHEHQGQFQVFRYNCQMFNNKPNEDSFFKFFLKDVGHKLYDEGKPSVKRDRLFKYLITKGKTSEEHHILLFFDDAHRLNEIEYNWLMDIFNELDRYGITLTTILVGQLELHYKRNSFIESDMRQIVGRFMAQKHIFEGINDISDLEYLLAGFDYSTEYPQNSNWSYTRYFFPKDIHMGID